MNDRGQYGKRAWEFPEIGDWGHTYVGLKPIHTPGDSDRATRQMDIEMNAIVDAAYRAMGVDPTTIRNALSFSDSPAKKREWRAAVLAAKTKASQSPLWGFWLSVISPTYDDWMKFRGENESPNNIFITWEEYEKWLEKVRVLRAQVKEHGIKLETPEPADLTKSLPDEAVQALKDVGKETLTLVKWGLIGVLGIGAVVAITSVAANVHKGRDPLESFKQFYPGRRRS